MCTQENYVRFTVFSFRIPPLFLLFPPLNFTTPSLLLWVRFHISENRFSIFKEHHFFLTSCLYIWQKVTTDMDMGFGSDQTEHRIHSATVTTFGRVHCVMRGAAVSSLGGWTVKVLGTGCCIGASPGHSNLKRKQSEYNQERERICILINFQ